MSAKLQSHQIKAVILAAGIGSRIKPLTANCPKCLLKVDGKTILEMMLSHLQECGINEVVFVLGYLEGQIRDFVSTHFQDLKANYVINDRYEDTNTGFSLMLARDIIGDSVFIKLDADVVFDIEILRRLIECEYANCLCIDKNIKLESEEIKVVIEDNNRVIKASKTVNPKDAVGESIGIEKISRDTAKLLFDELEVMMGDKENYQEYYEGAYERLIKKNVPFYALDISGLQWTEIDTKEDFVIAERIFSGKRRVI